ncbi:phosphoadenosine phosphosulfate reductase family protein [Vibrio phage 1.291.O._10N.286.55.F6]|nr:phosphoadenosine phosphosulfate reductase family protein [Vibrio phage 1.291.O._10N.286.55.F6]
MKKVVSFSGGRTSAYLCYLMKEKFGNDVDFIYMDTGAEHIETYRFIRRVNQHFELNLTCLRGDFNQPLGSGHSYKIVDIDDLKPDLGPFRDMCMKYGTPTVASGWCTSRIKQETHDKYCNEKYGKGEYQTWLGIRADEPKRLGGVGKNESLKYMAEISGADKEDVLDFWSNMPFDLNIPEWLGNCVFCFKKSNLKLAAAQRDEPEMYIEWLEMIESAPDRNKKEGRNSMHMYRKQKTLPEVVAMFDGSTGEEIKSRIRGAKMTETGSCSESCEVFVCEANQVDMFE